MTSQGIDSPRRRGPGGIFTVSAAVSLEPPASSSSATPASGFGRKRKHIDASTDNASSQSDMDQLKDSHQLLGQLSSVALISEFVPELELEAPGMQLSPLPLYVSLIRTQSSKNMTEEVVQVISDESGQQFGRLGSVFAGVLGPVIGGKPFMDGKVKVMQLNLLIFSVPSFIRPVATYLSRYSLTLGEPTMEYKGPEKYNNPHIPPSPTPSTRIGGSAERAYDSSRRALSAASAPVADSTEGDTSTAETITVSELPEGPSQKKFKIDHDGHKSDKSDRSQFVLPKGQPNCLAGISFVFTGELKSLDREVAQQLAKCYGGRVTGAPSSNTTYVVIGEGAGGAKLQKLVGLTGPQKMSEEEFFDLISTRSAALIAASSREAALIGREARSRPESHPLPGPSSAGSTSNSQAEPAAESDQPPAPSPATHAPVVSPAAQPVTLSHPANALPSASSSQTHTTGAEPSGPEPEETPASDNVRHASATLIRPSSEPQIRWNLGRFFDEIKDGKGRQLKLGELISPALNSNGIATKEDLGLFTAELWRDYLLEFTPEGLKECHVPLVEEHVERWLEDLVLPAAAAPEEEYQVFLNGLLKGLGSQEVVRFMTKLGFEDAKSLIGYEQKHWLKLSTRPMWQTDPLPAFQKWILRKVIAEHLKSREE